MIIAMIYNWIRKYVYIYIVFAIMYLTLELYITITKMYDGSQCVINATN